MARYAIAVRTRIVILDATTDITALKHYIDYEKIGLACAPDDCNDSCQMRASVNCAYRLIQDDAGRYWHLHDDSQDNTPATKKMRNR